MKNIKSKPTHDLGSMSDAIRRELIRREDEARISDNRASIGKCYRFRNSYSCPEKPSDYWWLYARVEKLDPSEQATGWSFQEDKDGVIQIAQIKHVHRMLTGWEEITTHKFYVEYAKVLARMRAMKSRKVRWGQ